ncbi:MAG: EamA family transporter [Candidatus Magasanikbacteria bacterium]|mgnify:FL=1|jgi:small multidrug resistance pump|nr:EamA family transporter [Candidatus Magasanikbacteria bacterium]MBT4314760.1 EamA family transporter [Candidatus Magasanikbacteria bacterium]MBT4547537.1 EamA family transporter [Candidatus Magasanikbacteria bacterium]MBT6819397.1 EamA family transporter [Candidatus Magasanikbacteria bacterium]
MNFYLLLAALLVFDLIGLSLAKIWSIKPTPAYLILTVISYAIMAVFLTFSLKYEGVAITNIIWVALSIIGMTLIGYFVFNESITALQFAGIGIIIIGITLIQIK